jgi:glutathione S-transferase
MSFITLRRRSLRDHGGLIPVMRHGDFALFESKAIATYIDMTFSGPKLIPRPPPQLELCFATHSIIDEELVLALGAARSRLPECRECHVPSNK